MKITDVKLISLSAPLKESEQWRFHGGLVVQMNCNLVIVSTDDGITGVGEIGEMDRYAVKEVVEKVLKKEVLNEDPFNVEKLWDKMYRRIMYSSKTNGVVAISGIETALWDIIGKATNRPVYDLLGGRYHQKIRVYASAGLWKREDRNLKSTEGLAEELSRYVDEGFTAVKIRVGRDPEKDLERVKIAREAIGDEIDLLIDAQCKYNVPLAIKMGRRFERYEPFWLEEPLPPDDIEGYQTVTQALSIPIAAGENAFTRYGFRELIAKRAVDIVQADASRAGGILECKKIASMASAFHIQYAPHCWWSAVALAANLHSCICNPNSIILEYRKVPSPLRDELLLEPIEVKNGYIEAPTKPGLGLELNMNILKKYPYKDVPSGVYAL